MPVSLELGPEGCLKKRDKKRQKMKINATKRRKCSILRIDPDPKEELMSTEYPEILTLQQAAVMLQISERTIQRMLKNGEIPGSRIGGQWRFDRDQLRAMVRGEWKPEPDQVGMAERESLVLGVEIPQAFLDMQQAARKRLADKAEESKASDGDDQ
jgi:excisionase family DNA binding protein